MAETKGGTGRPGYVVLQELGDGQWRIALEW